MFIYYDENIITNNHVIGKTVLVKHENFQELNFSLNAKLE